MSYIHTYIYIYIYIYDISSLRVNVTSYVHFLSCCTTALFGKLVLGYACQYISYVFQVYLYIGQEVTHQ